MKLIFLIAILLLIFPVFVLAANQTNKDISINIILPEIINSSGNYSELFLLKNRDDTPNLDDNLLVEVSFNLTPNNLSFKTNRSLNSYTRTGMGSIFFNETNNYSLCVFISAINYNDTNEENDKDCKNISVNINFTVESNNTINQTINSTQNISANNTNSTNETINKTFNKTSCSCKINITTDKDIYNYGDTIHFKLIPCSKNFSAEYWAEDLDNKEIKSRINTTSDAEKSFTPKLDYNTAIILKTKNSCNNESKRVVGYKKQDVTQDPYLNIDSSQSDNNIVLVTIDGYKGNTGKTLISVWLENEGEKYSEVSKAYVTKKSTEFKFKIPVIIFDTATNGEYNVIAEGLDMNASTIVELTRKKVLKKVEPKKQIQPVIESFYTRKQNYNKTIHIYAKINIVNNTMLKISSGAQTKIFYPDKYSIDTDINISGPKDLIVAELYINDSFSDTKIIFLNLTTDEIKENTPPKVNLLTANTVKEIKADNYSLTNVTSANVVQNDEKSKSYGVFLAVSVAFIAGILIFKDELKNMLKKNKTI